MELHETKMPGIGHIKWEDEDSGFENENGDANDFAQMLEETPGGANIKEGTIINGKVVRLTDDAVIVDIGHKSEGEIPIGEFHSAEGLKVDVGDMVEVYLDTFEDN